MPFNQVVPLFEKNTAILKKKNGTGSIEGGSGPCGLIRSWPIDFQEDAFTPAGPR